MKSMDIRFFYHPEFFAGVPATSQEFFLESRGVEVYHNMIPHPSSDSSYTAVATSFDPLKDTTPGPKDCMAWCHKTTGVDKRPLFQVADNLIKTSNRDGNVTVQGTIKSRVGLRFLVDNGDDLPDLPLFDKDRTERDRKVEFRFTTDPNQAHTLNCFEFTEHDSAIALNTNALQRDDFMAGHYDCPLDLLKAALFFVDPRNTNLISPQNQIMERAPDVMNALTHMSQANALLNSIDSLDSIDLLKVMRSFYHYQSATIKFKKWRLYSLAGDCLMQRAKLFNLLQICSSGGLRINKEAAQQAAEAALNAYERAHDHEGIAKAEAYLNG